MKMKSSLMLLAGDIGGTKTLLGAFDPSHARPRPIAVRSFATLDYDDLTTMIAAFLKDDAVNDSTIETACFGVAGPAARTGRELAQVRHVTARFGRVGVERVISGRGLLVLHTFTQPQPCMAEIDVEDPDAAADISRAALDRRCRGCVETLDLLVD